VALIEIDVFEEHCSKAEKETLRLLRLIVSDLQQILQNQEIQMSTPPVTRQQLNDALDQLGTTMATSFADLEAKIAAGQVTTPEDFSVELAKVKADIAAAIAADPNSQTTTTPTDGSGDGTAPTA
jgi:hypothetical protein